MSFQIFSTNEHVIEAPDVWTARMSKAQWGDRIPHVRTKDDGNEVWMIDGAEVPLVGAGSAAASMSDRADEPTTWRDVPSVITNVTERAAAMDAQGVGHAVLYPSVAGIGGETFGRIEDPELELACVQAYNDWLIEEVHPAMHFAVVLVRGHASRACPRRWDGAPGRDFSRHP